MSKIEIKIYDSDGNQIVYVVVEGKGLQKLMENFARIGQGMIFREFFPIQKFEVE